MANKIPCEKRTYPLQLGMEYLAYYSINLAWLRHMLERLGYTAALRIWVEAIKIDKDPLLDQILKEGWEEVRVDLDVEKEKEKIIQRWFNRTIQGVSKREAYELMEVTPPFNLIKKRFNSFNYTKQITAYETLHLFCNVLARVAEGLIKNYGKQGELIVYDAMLYELTENPPPRLAVSEFVRHKSRTLQPSPLEMDIYGAGRDVEITRASERELIYTVKACEWARYYQEHHPTVGYLMACSLDHAISRIYNKSLQLQRTSTIMEGGKVCDFRFYSHEVEGGG